MDPTISTLAERPDLSDAHAALSSAVPAFVSADPSCWDLFSVRHLYPALQLVAQLGERTVGIAQAAPFAWSGMESDLPSQGWDEVVGSAVRGACGGLKPATAVSALFIGVAAEYQQRGISAVMLSGLKDAARTGGFRDLVAPVRPTLKHLEPRVPMRQYAARRRGDGLPTDPWLRTHVRAGGRIVGVCPASMTVGGSLHQWRTWTALPFDSDGDVEVPGALTPVRVSQTHDYGVYVEPNVWIHHPLP